MKRYIIVTTIFILGVGLLGVESLQAQDTKTADVTVSTNVVSEFSLNVPTNTDFGDVVTGTTPTLDPTSSGSNTDVGNEATVGEVEVTGGSSGTMVNYSLSNTTLTLTSDGSDIQYTAWLAGNPESDQTGNETILYDETGSQTNGGNAALNSSGNYYLFLGGTLTDTDGSSDLPSSASGSYSGDITVTVSYN